MRSDFFSKYQERVSWRGIGVPLLLFPEAVEECSWESEMESWKNTGFLLTAHWGPRWGANFQLSQLHISELCPGPSSKTMSGHRFVEASRMLPMQWQNQLPHGIGHSWEDVLNTCDSIAFLVGFVLEKPAFTGNQPLLPVYSGLALWQVKCLPTLFTHGYIFLCIQEFFREHESSLRE